MKLPCEMCIWKLVPLIKKELVLNLYHKKEQKQTQIAKLLHMSKASISHYINGKRGKSKIKSPKAHKIIDTMAVKLLKGVSYTDLKDDFCDICKLLQEDLLHNKIC